MDMAADVDEKDAVDGRSERAVDSGERMGRVGGINGQKSGRWCLLQSMSTTLFEISTVHGHFCGEHPNLRAVGVFGLASLVMCIFYCGLSVGMRHLIKTRWIKQEMSFQSNSGYPP